MARWRRFICPSCKQKTGVEILYGLPTQEAFEAAERGELVLGGCMLGEGDPERECASCGNQWLIKHKVPADWRPMSEPRLLVALEVAAAMGPGYRFAVRITDDAEIGTQVKVVRWADADAPPVTRFVRNHVFGFAEQMAGLRTAVIPALPEGPQVLDGEHVTLTVCGENAEMKLSWWTTPPHGCEQIVPIVEWLRWIAERDEEDATISGSRS